MSTGTHINGNFARAPYATTDWTTSNINGRIAKRARVDGRSLQENVQAVLGSSNVTTVTSRNLDLLQGHPHSTTGIPYAIQGTASVINVDVSEYLATFQDPLKAILQTTIHQEAKVIVTRKYVVGGRSLITPEHAPARTVSIQEDAREVMMTRYGGDIEMNLNLFLRPDDAREELAMKIGAQRRELERTLIEHGYSALMEEGTNIVDALIRSNPSYSSAGGTSEQTVIDAAERINITTVFGSMSKHPFPIANLLAAAKYASAYTTSNEKGSVLILPHGTPDILRYTRKENMVFDIAGPDLLARNNGKPISMELENTYVDPNTSVKILIQRTMPTFDSGVANPDVGMGGLTDTSTFGMFYNVATDDKIVDFESRTWRPAPTYAKGDEVKKMTFANIVDYMVHNITSKSDDNYTTYRAILAGEVQVPVNAVSANAVLSALKKLFGESNLANNAEATLFNLEVASGDKVMFNVTPDPAFAAAMATLYAIPGFWTTVAEPSDKDDAVQDFFKQLSNTSPTNIAALLTGLQYASPTTCTLARPKMTAVMSSAILAAPGSDTGELMIGYPFTSVSTSSTEIVKIQLRVYMGAVLKKPENVIIMRDVFFEGLESGHRFDDLQFVPMEATDYARGFVDIAEITKNNYTKYDIGSWVQTCILQQNALAPVFKDNTFDAKTMSDHLVEEGIPTRLYHGAVNTAAGATKQQNNGHLGILDDPKMVDRLYGSFVYNAGPDPKH